MQDSLPFSLVLLPPPISLTLPLQANDNASKIKQQRTVTARQRRPEAPKPSSSAEDGPVCLTDGSVASARPRSKSSG